MLEECLRDLTRDGSCLLLLTSIHRIQIHTQEKLSSLKENEEHQPGNYDHSTHPLNMFG